MSPFTLGGDYIPKPPSSKGPIKVRKEKRGQSIVTTILNLPYQEPECQELAAKIKKRLGCGGSVKNGVIEIQGEKVEQVKQLLHEWGIKAI